MEDTRTNSSIDSVKYYLKLEGVATAVVKVVKVDGKYNRFIAIIKQAPHYVEKTKIVKCIGGERKFTSKVLGSNKKATSEFLEKYCSDWIKNGFVSELPQNFSKNMTEYLKFLFMYNYGHNDQILDYNPLRYEKDVKLMNHEFRMFNKPQD
jgi:hypothetical protein